MVSNLSVAAGLRWHWSEKWKSLWYWNGSGGTGERAAADFGCEAGDTGRNAGGGEGILHNALHGQRKIQTGMPAPAPRASPHSHCWPGGHVSGPAKAQAGGPARPAPS